MASRKKTQPSTGSLFGERELTPVARAPITVEPESSEEDDLPQRPHLRVVPPSEETPSEDVVIEPTADGRYVVSLLRHHGTTVASVRYTRAQLELLLRRIPPALELGSEP